MVQNQQQQEREAQDDSAVWTNKNDNASGSTMTAAAVTATAASRKLAGALPSWRRFYAVRKCETLRGPALFFDWDDCSLHVQATASADTVESSECKQFTVLTEAVDYLVDHILSQEERQQQEGVDEEDLPKQRQQQQQKQQQAEQELQKDQEEGEFDGQFLSVHHQLQGEHDELHEQFPYHGQEQRQQQHGGSFSATDVPFPGDGELHAGNAHDDGSNALETIKQKQQHDDDRNGREGPTNEDAALLLQINDPINNGSWQHHTIAGGVVDASAAAADASTTPVVGVVAGSHRKRKRKKKKKRGNSSSKDKQQSFVKDNKKRKRQHEEKQDEEETNIAPDADANHHHDDDCHEKQSPAPQHEQDAAQSRRLSAPILTRKRRRTRQEGGEHQRRKETEHSHSSPRHAEREPTARKTTTAADAGSESGKERTTTPNWNWSFFLQNDPWAKTFEEKFKLLSVYKERHNTCNVSATAAVAASRHWPSSDHAAAARSSNRNANVKESPFSLLEQWVEQTRQLIRMHQSEPCPDPEMQEKVDRLIALGLLQGEEGDDGGEKNDDDDAATAANNTCRTKNSSTFTDTSTRGTRDGVRVVAAQRAAATGQQENVRDGNEKSNEKQQEREEGLDDSSSEEEDEDETEKARLAVSRGGKRPRKRYTLQDEIRRWERSFAEYFTLLELYKERFGTCGGTVVQDNGLLRAEERDNNHSNTDVNGNEKYNGQEDGFSSLGPWLAQTRAIYGHVCCAGVNVDDSTTNVLHHHQEVVQQENGTTEILRTIDSSLPLPETTRARVRGKMKQLADFGVILEVPRPQKRQQPQEEPRPQREAAQNVAAARDNQHDVWDDWCGRLQAFKEQMGHVNVPNLGEHAPLFDWLSQQRAAYDLYKQGKPSTMTAVHVVKLTEMGCTLQFRSFCTDTDDNNNAALEESTTTTDAAAGNTASRRGLSWEDYAWQWLEYRAKHGRDPESADAAEEDDSALSALGAWVVRQRDQYARLQRCLASELTPNQVQELTNWGFDWNCNVQHGPATATTTQQQQNRRQTCVQEEVIRQRQQPPEQEQKSVTAASTIRDLPPQQQQQQPQQQQQHAETTATTKKSWKERYQQLLRYKDLHGTTAVPSNYPGLGSWVTRQRMYYARYMNGHATSRQRLCRIKLLESIGFDFHEPEPGKQELWRAPILPPRHRACTTRRGEKFHRQQQQQQSMAATASRSFSQGGSEPEEPNQAGTAAATEQDPQLLAAPWDKYKTTSQ